MRKGLSRAGIGNAGDFENYVQLAAKYGFEAVDTGGRELAEFVDKRTLSGAKEFLAENGMAIGAIGLSVEWRKDEAAFLEGLAGLAADAKVASELGGRACTTWFLPSVDENPAHFLAVATRRLRQCAQVLGAYGLGLGLEFVGPHHLRNNRYPFLWEIRDTLDWVDAIGEPNVGLLLDSYHWYTTEATVNDLLRLSPMNIVHVHLNDAPNVPVHEVLDNDRLFPGEGVINLGAFVNALSKIGYEGVVAQEILTKTPVTLPVEAQLERSRAGYDKVFAQIQQ